MKENVWLKSHQNPKKPYFSQDMAFLGVKWSQNQILGPKIHLKLVFNHTFFIEKNFKVDVLDSNSNHTILLGSVSHRKKTFSSHVNACNYLPITFIIAIFGVEFKSGLKILIAGD